MLTVGYYKDDRNCDISLAKGDRDTSLESLGRSLADWIYSHNAVFGESVDIVAHSTGGLIARAALTGLQKSAGMSGWAPYLYVEDIVTLGTPHLGTSFAEFCVPASASQCKQIRSTSSFMSWLYANPQSTFGTDWTFVGAADDLLMDPRSTALGILVHPPTFQVVRTVYAGHLVMYDSGILRKFAQDVQGVSYFAQVHMGMLFAAKDPNACCFSVWEWNYHGEVHSDIEKTNVLRYGRFGMTWEFGAPNPIDWAFFACQYWSLW